MIDLEAFVLIGGRSSRLGLDKALVEIGGLTLAERAARTIETAFEDVRVSFVTGTDAQFPRDAIAGLARPVVTDLRPGFGAWSGLHVALSYARREWALVLACDYPFASANLLKYLAEQAGTCNNAVVPVQSDGRLQPLCAIYRADPLLAEIEKLMYTGCKMPPLVEFFDRPMTRLVEPPEYAAIGSPARLFLNINAPDDLRRARVFAESGDGVAE